MHRPLMLHSCLIASMIACCGEYCCCRLWRPRRRNIRPNCRTLNTILGLLYKNNIISHYFNPSKKYNRICSSLVNSFPIKGTLLSTTLSTNLTPTVIINHRETSATLDIVNVLNYKRSMKLPNRQVY